MSADAAPGAPAPFDGWPVQLVDAATGVRAWFCPPRTIVFCFEQPEIDLATAQRVVAAIEAVLYPRRDAIRALGGMRVVHDARRVREFSTQALRYLQKVWHRLRPEDIDHAFFVNEGTMGALAMTVLQTLNLVAMISTHRMLTYCTLLDVALEGVEVPPPHAVFPAVVS